MAKRYTKEFRRDAVRMALTGGSKRPSTLLDLGGGLSTLNKWAQHHQRDDLMSVNLHWRVKNAHYQRCNFSKITTCATYCRQNRGFCNPPNLNTKCQDYQANQQAKKTR